MIFISPLFRGNENMSLRLMRFAVEGGAFTRPATESRCSNMGKNGQQ